MDKLVLTIPTLYGDHHTTAVKDILAEGLEGVAGFYVSSAFKQVSISLRPEEVVQAEQFEKPRWRKKATARESAQRRPHRIRERRRCDTPYGRYPGSVIRFRSPRARHHLKADRSGHALG